MERRCNCEIVKSRVFFIICWYFMNTKTNAKTRGCLRISRLNVEDHTDMELGMVTSVS